MNIMPRLLLTVLLASIPIGLLHGLSVQKEEREAREEISMVASGIAHRAAAEQRRVVEGARQMLSALSQLPAVREGDAAACSLIARRLQSQFKIYTVIGVANADGRIWCSSTRRGTDVSDRPYFQQAVRTRKFTTGGYVVGRVWGLQTLNFSLPFEDSEGRLSGVLVAGLDLTHLTADLAKVELPPASSLVIYGPDKRVLVHVPGGAGVGTSLPPAFEGAFNARRAGTFDAAWLDGSERLVAFVPPAADPDMPFLVAVGIDRAQALAQVEEVARRSWMVLITVLAAALLFAWWFAERYVRRPVETLAKTVRAWRDGDTAARVGPLDSGSEFDDLGRAFDALSDTAVQRQRRLREALESTTDSVAVLAPNWNITFLNERAIEHMGGPHMVGRNLWHIYPEAIDQPIGRALKIAMAERRPVVVTFENPEMGSHFETNAYPTEGGELILFSRDVSEEHRAQQELRRLALYDPLTNLPNRSHAMDIAQRTATQGSLSALMILDLDNFKNVNDSLGHPAGDEMLREVAVRLSSCVGERGVVARLGGDEFVALLLDTPRELSIQLAVQLLSVLEREPFLVRDRLYQTSCSCGLVLAVPEDDDPVEELMANADIALYRAKAAGGGTCCIYTTADGEAYQARRQLEEELASAATNGEFELHYQPQVRLLDGALVGAEALLRWRHPTRGLLLPASFMDALDGSRHAVAVGTWVIEEACRQASIWWRGGNRLRVSVNLFAQQLDSGELPQLVQAMLDRYHLPPEALALELTENIALSAQTEVKRTLETLRMLGISLAFDDFGTGFASLTTLKDLPVDRLKIDRSFVTHLPRNEHDKAIVEAVLALARTLNLEVVAEGIETAEQAEYLLARGCQQAQGFLYGKSMTAREFGTRMLHRQPDSRSG